MKSSDKNISNFNKNNDNKIQSIKSPMGINIELKKEILYADDLSKKKIKSLASFDHKSYVLCLAVCPKLVIILIIKKKLLKNIFY